MGQLKKGKGTENSTQDSVKNLVQDTKKEVNIKDGLSLNTNSKEILGNTIFHVTEDYLNENYKFRFNEITIDIEITKKNENCWKTLNEHALFVELKKKGINIPMNSLISILKSDFPRIFNPIKDYFKNLPNWDRKTDYISQFLGYIILDDENERELFKKSFKKWTVRTVKCATLPGYFNKQAFILSDDGNGQNIGKSSWCRYLCPPALSKFIAEDISNDKDARILLCKNFLINLDELAVLSKREINHLKAFFSKEQINERLPYDRKNSIIDRVASFIGSTNKSTFLQDETGSVRWIVFSIKQVEWSYKNSFIIDNLWSQAYTLSKDENYDEVFTSEDVLENEKRNEKYTVFSPERELINKFFKIPSKSTGENVTFLTATEVLIAIKGQSTLQSLNNIGVGKALKASGFKRIKSNGVYGYYVEKLDSSFENAFTVTKNKLP
ncbi:VapE domain-containing protein [Polaribacter atrinae]|uniref:VapE domain-containing protein n=1 Tax=Polaribacter atrinae TaxID=1333662 RepID=UPI002491BD91|nr:VapE domain-containing protein [Polaribacter atrinae]